MSKKEQKPESVRKKENTEKDRRIQKTRRSIQAALMDLLHAKRFESITVQNIIDRADVGRSTFYAHYQDKDDLVANFFAEMMEDITRGVKTKTTEGTVVFPVAELFDHIKSQAPEPGVWQDARGREFLFSVGQAYWIRRLEREMKDRLPAGMQPRVPIPVLAQMVVGAAIGLLQWWLNKKMPYTPGEMQSFFDRVMQPGVRMALGMD